MSLAQSNQKFHYRILLLIAFVAFVLRLVSIDHDLPYQILADEGSDLTTAVQLLQGELPARHVRYHRSLIAYNNLIPIAFVGLVNFVDGDVRSVADFQNLYFANRAEFTYATRLWMATLTTTAIFLTGLAASYLHPKIGVFAALILALNAFYFHTSLYALPDALGACATALSLWLIMRLAYFGRTRDYILASLSLALLMLAKLHLAPLGIGLLLAHGSLVYSKTSGDWPKFFRAYCLDKNLWLAAFAGILGNLLFNPLAFLYPQDLFFELDRLQNIVIENAADNLIFRLQFAIQEIQTLILLIWTWALPLSLIALWQFWQNRHNRFYWILLASFAFVSYSCLNARFGPISHFYYWNGWIILMACMAATGLFALWEVLSTGKLKFIFWAIAILFVVLEASFFVHIFNIMNRPTTQELAREYVVNQIPAGSRILASDPLIAGVPLYRTNTSIERAYSFTGSMLSQWAWWLKQPIETLPSPSYDIFGPEMALVIDTFEDEIKVISSNQIEYFIIADYCDGAHQFPDLESDRAFPPISDTLIENWELLAEFSPYNSNVCLAPIHGRTKLSFSNAIFQQEHLGPLIRIYRILP